jgi:hypothetical protein
LGAVLAVQLVDWQPGYDAGIVSVLWGERSFMVDVEVGHSDCCKYVNFTY